MGDYFSGLCFCRFFIQDPRYGFAAGIERERRKKKKMSSSYRRFQSRSKRRSKIRRNTLSYLTRLSVKCIFFLTLFFSFSVSFSSFLDAFRAVFHSRLQFILHLSTRSGAGYFRPRCLLGLLTQISAALLARNPFQTFQQKGVFQKCTPRLFGRVRSILFSSR